MPLSAKREFLGRGWSWPLRVEGGAIATASLDELVAQSIRLILSTNPGEREMRPAFGAGLRDFVFEPLSVGTLERLRTRVRESLIDWEPRIDVLNVSVESDPTPGAVGLVRILVDYRVRATNARRNLVYPFYLEEGAA
ncbi:MAG: GPW/gp25 family protein [Bryobacteraceae bacterium]|nr:GPW/gp25 family protein [Bryobacteraceae bacterium]